MDDPAGASSQQREECRCGLLLTVAVPAKQVCSPVGDRCVQITVTLNYFFLNLVDKSYTVFPIDIRIITTTANTDGYLTCIVKHESSAL